MPKIIQVLSLQRHAYGWSGQVLCDNGQAYDVTLHRCASSGHWYNRWEPIDLNQQVTR